MDRGAIFSVLLSLVLLKAHFSDLTAYSCIQQERFGARKTARGHLLGFLF